ncbi:MAG: amidohydrolase family protein [Xylophilus ampelinus]
MPPPDPQGAGALPDGACDCHVHVVGPRDRHPMAADRRYTPGPAPVEALRGHLARLGLGRAVVVQPSVYGTDNACALDALDRLDGAGRGVAVPPDDAGDAELRAMHARGVRGVRVNLESAGGRDLEAARAALARWSARVADLGWHLQLYAAPAVVAGLTDRLDRLPAPVVLDHFAMAAGAPGPDPDAVCGLLRTGRVFVKLSAPYRLGDPGSAAAWAARFLAAAPSAVLWGSDWPHTARDPGRGRLEVSAYRAVPAEALARDLRAWLPTPALRQAVLVDNPAALYGF